jgi:hypothetical protein
MRRSAPAALLLALSVAAALAACAPALDWRELRPVDAGGLVLLMPCKAVVQQRQVPLAGRTVRLVLNVCEAAGHTWALAQADVEDPVRVGAALLALRAAATANIGAVPSQPFALAVLGATPQQAAGGTRLAGRRPDGTAVAMELAVFARGTRVFQATVLGEAVARDEAETFFSSVHFVP